MLSTLFEINRDIQKLTQKKNDLLSSLKTGMVIRFPDWDVCHGVNKTEMEKRLRPGSTIPFDNDPRRINRLVFVEELENGGFTFLTKHNSPAVLDGKMCQFLTKEDAFTLICRNHGEILSGDVSDILEKFGVK